LERRAGRLIRISEIPRAHHRRTNFAPEPVYLPPATKEGDEVLVLSENHLS
jgi:hypothetical protein